MRELLIFLRASRIFDTSTFHARVLHVSRVRAFQPAAFLLTSFSLVPWLLTLGLMEAYPSSRVIGHLPKVLLGLCR